MPAVSARPVTGSAAACPALPDRVAAHPTCERRVEQLQRLPQWTPHPRRRQSRRHQEGREPRCSTPRMTPCCAGRWRCPKRWGAWLSPSLPFHTVVGIYGAGLSQGCVCMAPPGERLPVRSATPHMCSQHAPEPLAFPFRLQVIRARRAVEESRPDILGLQGPKVRCRPGL